MNVASQPAPHKAPWFTQIADRTLQRKRYSGKFHGPWPKACQIISPWTLTRSNILFFTGLNPNWTIFKAKIDIEPQLLQLLLLLLLLLLKFNPLRAVRRARFGTSFSATLAPFLSRLSLLGVTLGGLEMQLSGPKTDFGAQGAP